MKQKFKLPALLLLAFVLGNISLQAQNPYKSLGVEMETLTLSKGKYLEFFPNDSLVQIGSVIFDTRNNLIISFVQRDTAYSEANLEPEVSSRFLQTDPYASKFPNVSPYVYTLNNPIRLVDPDGRAPKDPFLITVKTYIPYRSVAGFRGDGNISNTYRTSHSVGVETNPIVSSNPLTSNDGGLTGNTKTVPLPTGGLSRYAWSDKASEGEGGGFTASVSRSDANGGDNAVVSFEGSSRNPLTPGGPKIDYSFSIEIVPGKDGGAPKVKVSGSHDGFPAYEINVTGKDGISYRVYHDTPNSKWEVLRLFGDSDTEVKDEK